MNRLRNYLSARNSINVAKSTLLNGVKNELLFKNSMRHSRLLQEDVLSELRKLTKRENETPANVQIVDWDVLEAVFQMKERHAKTAVLSFASDSNPCGGFLNGYKAQEETLAYASNLYSILKQKQFKPFYKVHRSLHESLSPNNIIYSQNVVFFKDQEHRYLKEPLIVGVITAAAVNRNSYRNKLKPLPHSAVQQRMKQKVESIFATAALMKVDALILGAFGCGEYGNDPNMVAELMKNALEDERWKYAFKTVCIAIPDHDKREVFESIFDNK